MGCVSLCSDVVDAQEVVGGLEVQKNFEETVIKEQLVSSKTYEMCSGSWSGRLRSPTCKDDATFVAQIVEELRRKHDQVLLFK